MPLAAAAILRCVLKDDVFPMLVRVRFVYRRCLCTAIGGVAIFFLACFESNLSQTERLSGLELGHLLSSTTVTDTFPIQLDHFTSSPAMARCGTFLGNASYFHSKLSFILIIIIVFSFVCTAKCSTWCQRTSKCPIVLVLSIVFQ